jgi:hypothetical protein
MFSTNHEHSLVAVDDAHEDVHVVTLAVLISWYYQHIWVTVRALKKIMLTWAWYHCIIMLSWYRFHDNISPWQRFNVKEITITLHVQYAMRHCPKRAAFTFGFSHAAWKHPLYVVRCKCFFNFGGVLRVMYICIAEIR